jgi:hypothetical protein
MYAFIFNILQLSLLLKGTVVAPPDKFGQSCSLSHLVYLYLYTAGEM